MVKLKSVKEKLNIVPANDILIFILDDDEMEAEEIGLLLQQNGFSNYKIFMTSLSMLENIDPAARIFIIDYRLDVYNGLEVIEKVKKTLPHCYFIMLSGMRNYSVIEEFNNNVIRGKFVTKGENSNNRVIKFIKEFIEDMIFMKAYYEKALQVEKDISEIKKLIQ